ncbi:MAG: hypothetical protein IPP43_15645 [Chitinophagaceae bacterium]|nr:hypothetical protein [Chitinophagaceae bacterium]MBK9569526.1 hypothetical protein [Chitinophagaceae bacterium]MBL0132350.1 hypothetical protein [Chitinophagaceae bacterium]MBL0271627.1 hypothetical protein [Chitinophagaceae bacterium]
MEYIIAGICFTLFIAVIFWGLNVLKETRRMTPPKKDEEEDEQLHHIWPK